MPRDRTNKKAPSARRVLLLSCSQRKRQTRSLLPANERYDGPAFRVLRRHLAAKPVTQTDVLILSAKWGLIPGDFLLMHYDQKMSERRVRELRPLIAEQLRKILKAQRYKEMLVIMSKSYREVLDDQELSKIPDLKIYIPQGRQGQKISALYDWLNGNPPPAKKIPKNSLKNKCKVCLRGVEISYTKEKALKLAGQALPQDAKTAMRIFSWYVQLGKRRISPKWLVSLLTDLPVSAFVTDEARRVLAQLDIKVHRAPNWNNKSWKS